MKKREKKEEVYLIDLSDRKKIKIVHSTRTAISDKDMQAFEEKIIERYKSLSEFTRKCIEQNLSQYENEHTLNEYDYEKTMKNLLEQNKLLEHILKSNIPDEKAPN